jgi:hypothetical protein
MEQFMKDNFIDTAIKDLKTLKDNIARRLGIPVLSRKHWGYIWRRTYRIRLKKLF